MHVSSFSLSVRNETISLNPKYMSLEYEFLPLVSRTELAANVFQSKNSQAGHNIARMLHKLIQVCVGSALLVLLLEECLKEQAR